MGRKIPLFDRGFLLHCEDGLGSGFGSAQPTDMVED
jgi:hypothetical protein